MSTISVIQPIIKYFFFKMTLLNSGVLIRPSEKIIAMLLVFVTYGYNTWSLAGPILRMKFLDPWIAPIWGKCCEHSTVFICDQIFSIFAGIRTSIASRNSSKFGQIGLRTAELATLDRLAKCP